MGHSASACDDPCRDWCQHGGQNGRRFPGRRRYRDDGHADHHHHHGRRFGGRRNDAVQVPVAQGRAEFRVSPQPPAQAVGTLRESPERDNQEYSGRHARKKRADKAKTNAEPAKREEYRTQTGMCQRRRRHIIPPLRGDRCPAVGRVLGAGVIVAHSRACRPGTSPWASQMGLSWSAQHLTDIKGISWRMRQIHRIGHDIAPCN